MGAPVEGRSWERIEREYGTLDRLLSYHHYGKSNDWTREPGTTEDGVERQKLMITAIIEKQDRINAEDLRRAWVDHMNPNAAGLVSEPFEGALLAMAKTHIPAADIGKYCDYSGLVSLSRSCHPIGLINAGDIQGAIDDIREIGQLYHTANSRGILWAEVTVIAIAAATKSKATVDSVLGAIFDNCDKVDRRFTRQAGIRREIERALKLTADCYESCLCVQNDQGQHMGGYEGGCQYGPGHRLPNCSCCRDIRSALGGRFCTERFDKTG
jgi:ADP-ribosylglycohydrolase